MIEFHADDYGMFPKAAERILECIENGSINGISIMPNGPCLEACMDLLQKKCTKPVKIAIHLNLMTQRPLSEPERIPDLVRADGSFCVLFCLCGRILRCRFL